MATRGGVDRIRIRGGGVGGGFASGNLPLPPAYTRNFAAGDTPDNYVSNWQAGYTYRNASGVMALSTAGNPRYEAVGGQNLAIKVEQAATNLNTNYNYAPTDLTGITTSGTGTAGGASIVSDSSSLLTTAKNEKGDTTNLATNVCTTGKLIKLDNSTGTGTAYLEFGGVASNTTAAHTFSTYIQCPTGTVLSLGATAATQAISSPTSLTRLALANFTPADTTSKCRVTVPIGGIAYMILNCFTAETYMSSVILISGATAARQAEGGLVDNNFSTRSYVNQSAGCVSTVVRVEDPTLTAYFLSIQNGANSTTANANSMSLLSQGASQQIRASSRANSTSATVTSGPVATQSAVNTHTIDYANRQFPAAVSWNTANTGIGGFISYAGAMDERTWQQGTAFSATLDHMAVGARNNNAASLLAGYIERIDVYNSQPTTRQLGQQIDFSNWVAIAGNGQSFWQTNWTAEGTVGTDAGAGYNGGEIAAIQEMEKRWVGKRCAILHQNSGGSSISQTTSVAGPDPYANSWSDGSSPKALLTRAINISRGFTNGGGTIVGHIADYGGSDTNLTQAQYTSASDYVVGTMLALPANKAATVTVGQGPIVVREPPKRTDGTAADSIWAHLRRFLRYYAALRGYTMGTSYNLLQANTQKDGLHLLNQGNINSTPYDIRLIAALAGITISDTPYLPATLTYAARSGTTVNFTIKLPTGATNSISAFYNASFYDQATALTVDTGASIARTPWSTFPTLQSVSGGYATYQGVLNTAPTNAGVISINDGSVYYNTPAAPSTYNPVPVANMFVTSGGNYPQGIQGMDVLLPYGSLPPAGGAHSNGFSNGFS